MKWLYLSGIVGGTVCSDLLQSHGMRQGNGRKWKLPLAVFFMAISFFSFHATPSHRSTELCRPRQRGEHRLRHGTCGSGAEGED